MATLSGKKATFEAGLRIDFDAGRAVFSGWADAVGKVARKGKTHFSGGLGGLGRVD